MGGTINVVLDKQAIVAIHAVQILVECGDLVRRNKEFPSEYNGGTNECNQARRQVRKSIRFNLIRCMRNLIQQGKVHDGIRLFI